MKVSVVIPAHNEEKNIAETIQALLAQDYSDLEIIVVNNASSDRTEEVAKGFMEVGPYQVKVVYEPKKGLLSARERGRKEAEGLIIANISYLEETLSQSLVHMIITTVILFSEKPR